MEGGCGRGEVGMGGGLSLSPKEPLILFFDWFARTCPLFLAIDLGLVTRSKAYLVLLWP